jgi:hypothetical protein
VIDRDAGEGRGIGVASHRRLSAGFSPNSLRVTDWSLSQPRPRHAGLEHDFPDLLMKPVDAPYGPYADKFSALQHKYGPFASISAEIARLKQSHGAH